MPPRRPSRSFKTNAATSSHGRFFSCYAAILALSGGCYDPSTGPDAEPGAAVEPTTATSSTGESGTVDPTTSGSIEPEDGSSTGSDDSPMGESTGSEEPGCEGFAEGKTRACGSNVGACSEGTQACVAGTWTACDAEPPSEEVCDDASLDEDCDGTVDEECGCATENPPPCPEFGACEGSQPTCEATGAWSECSILPGVELCGTGTDEDCDGTVDEQDCQECLPGDVRAGDCPQLGECGGNTQTCARSGEWSACEFAPSAEVCGGGDEDCDGLTNESDVGPTWYADLDDDGFHDATASVQSCAQPAGYIALDASGGEDCEDLNEFVQSVCTWPPLSYLTNHGCPMSSTQTTYRECPNHYDLGSASTVRISGGGFYTAQNTTWSPTRENGYVRLTQDCNFLEASLLQTTMSCIAHQYD